MRAAAGRDPTIPGNRGTAAGFRYPRIVKRRTLAILAGCIGLAVAPLLPVYPQRVMTRAMVIGHDGDVVSYGYEFGSIPAYFEHLRYVRHEDYALLLLGIDFTLALAVAAAIGSVPYVATRRVLARR